MISSGEKTKNLNRYALTRAWRAYILLLTLAFITGSCVPNQLRKFKDHSLKKDYQWIADQEVKCRADDEGCNQIHLIKGDACFQLAKQGIDKEDNYECAADELELGIKQTREWQLEDLDLNRAQNYENLCEALRNLQDLQTGDKANATGERLLTAAEGFFRLESEHLGAIYFVAKARYRKLQPELIDVPPENCQNVRDQVNQLLAVVEATTSRALGTRYEENYGILKDNLIAAIPDCQ